MLSLLSVAPMHLKQHWAYRSFASVENSQKSDQQESESKRPHLDKLIAEIDIQSEEMNATLESFQDSKQSLAQKIKEYKDNFLKTESDPEKLKIHRSKLNEAVTELIKVEKQLADLKSKSLVTQDEADTINLEIESVKNETEDFLTDLDVNETLLAKITENEKKEDENSKIKKENNDLKKEIARNIPSGATITKNSDENESDNKKEIKQKISKQNKVKSKNKNKKSTKEEAEQVCDHEKKEVLSEKSQELIQSQSMILQQMMNMNQMMMMLVQQNQIFQMQQHFQNQGPVNQQVYQYTPQNIGNWVYYPNGFKPGSMFPDQFGQYTPMTPPNPPAPVQGYNNWGPGPQFSFNPDPMMTPMMTPMTVNPGQFGSPSSFGYNMSQPIGPTPPFMQQGFGQPAFI